MYNYIESKGCCKVEEINLKDLFDYFISKISLIGIITIFIGILGCLYSMFMQTPMYNSYTTFVLTRVSDDNNSSITTTDITINSQLVSTYSQIIKSNRIMKQVIESLSLNYSLEDLKRAVTVTNVENTELIKISVNTSDPEISSQIANEIAVVFSKEIVDIYSIQNIAIIDKAFADANPYNVNILRQVCIYLIMGFGISLVIVFIAYYFDNKIKTVEEVEAKIGLPILGAVPNRIFKMKKLENGKGVASR